MSVIAVVQDAPKLFDADETIARFARRLAEAAEANADLVVFPEAFLGGYPKGVDFGVRVGMRLPESRELYRRYFESAFPRGSTRLDKIARLVRDAGVNCVAGLIESEHRTLYCSTATFDRSGAIAGWHRKLMPTAMERVIWGSGDASTIEPAALDIGVAATAICWENYMPRYRAHLYERGTRYWCAPTVDDREVWLPSMRMIALEGRCLVASACQVMTRADGPDEGFHPIQGDDPDAVLIRGGSCIVSPMGEVLHAPVFDQRGVFTVAFDESELIGSALDLDPAGHYTRPDVFPPESDLP